MNLFTPTWHLEALKDEINYIVLVYEKAEGFVFCPTNLHKPFRVGSNYDGNYPTDAAGAFSYYRSSFNQAFLNRVDWFIPFLQKIEQAEDFSLDDLQFSMRPYLRLLKGSWPW
ncbi:hypothetical protein [Crocosphaera chwakensis]|uniref:Uncharacterized protein n=1 Tax=Crocosphaera chwakensis CCY0110 TaxID=391612 RepID=A3IU72_9CHRO|nr:hypothetical protein [Crocosphaera chwakensis]EAZ89946.1 hypothetical protein CY0110_07114 [Crocosphaera chwakensis CCY0110]